MAKNTKLVNENVIDLDLSAIRKKKIRIDGDDSRILELNTSDLNLLVRLRECYPRLLALAQDAFKDLPDIDDSAEDYNFMTDESTGVVVDSLKKADTDMRELIDYIFDSNVSDICAPSGSMYDPINGQFRFEHIIDTLSGLYETSVTSEIKKITSNVQKHTDKYVRK